SFGRDPKFPAGESPIPDHALVAPKSDEGGSRRPVDPPLRNRPMDFASLCVRAPSVVEIHLPADLAAGCEFVTTGVLDSSAGAEGSVQLQVLTTKPDPHSGLLPSALMETQAGGPWTSDNRRISYGTPIVVNDGSQARKRFEAAFDDFRRWFPGALCYAKIVPVDEVLTLILFQRV